MSSFIAATGVLRPWIDCLCLVLHLDSILTGRPYRALLCNQVSRCMTSSHGRTGGEWADRVATTVLDCYHALGRNGKPQPHEWTVLAAILSENTDGSGSAGAFEVLSLATGNKCVGMNSLCGRGEVVNGMIAFAKRPELTSLPFLAVQIRTPRY